MEQIFMIEVFVKKIILKVEPPQKDEYELKMEEEARKREAEALAALEAAKKGKKAKPPKPKKKGKGKEPPPPSEEEVRFMQSCTVQMICLPLFDFYIAHDNFIAPPPPEPPGKKKPKKKPPKKKKGKAVPIKIVLPSEPLPEPPNFGVGNAVIFISRPSKLEQLLKDTPISISVWNRDTAMNCIGFNVTEWHESFFECLQRSEELNPCDMLAGEFRNTDRPKMVTNSIELKRHLQCEEDLQPSGVVEFFIRLSCLGNRIVTYFVGLPEMERLPARKYLNDEKKLKDVEVVRHWEGTTIETLVPVAYLFNAPDIMLEPKKDEPVPVVYEEFVFENTKSELEILAMGFPRGPCIGADCPKRREFRQHKYGSPKKIDASSVHKHLQGPCDRLDCPLAKEARRYICNVGAEKTCKHPCPTDYNDDSDMKL